MNEKRRDEFIEAATILFLRDGFAGVSMSSIAAAVGGSKTTLWSRFPSKKHLFEAVVDNLACRYRAMLAAVLVPPAAPNIPLSRLVNSLTNIFAADVAVDLRRILNERTRYLPELSSAIVETGAGDLEARLSEYFRSLMRTRMMRQGDAALAVRQFIALVAGAGPRCPLLCSGLTEARPTEQELEAASRAFVALWGEGYSHDHSRAGERLRRS